MTENPRIAVVGGTGALGKGIATRLARAGLPVVIGSRSSDKAAEAATQMMQQLSLARDAVEGADNATASSRGDIVIVAVPFASQADTLREIAENVKGKIVVDATVPLVPPKVARVSLPAEGSAAQIAAGVLGEDVTLVTAFHNVSAHKLGKDGPVDCDVLVFADDVEARNRVVMLIQRMGLHPLHGGGLANSAAAEAMTSVLIAINKKYGVAEGAGIRITGLDGSAGAR